MILVDMMGNGQQSVLWTLFKTGDAKKHDLKVGSVQGVYNSFFSVGCQLPNTNKKKEKKSGPCL